ncbi:hypothetical protein DFJ74DRAFT_385544 [Hyaloraphidium curvatum]|nr:hypothetical protein DFJ74DRAFT_385544 [Hyaloraphidium curvatum]
MCLNWSTHRPVPFVMELIVHRVCLRQREALLARAHQTLVPRRATLAVRRRPWPAMSASATPMERGAGAPTPRCRRRYDADALNRLALEADEGAPQSEEEAEDPEDDVPEPSDEDDEADDSEFAPEAGPARRATAATERKAPARKGVAKRKAGKQSISDDEGMPSEEEWEGGSSPGEEQEDEEEPEESSEGEEPAPKKRKTSTPSPQRASKGKGKEKEKVEASPQGTSKGKGKDMEETEAVPRSKFVGAPRSVIPHPRLAPGILNFLLDNRCPPTVRTAIFNSLGLFAAMRLAELFPDPFVAMFEARKLDTYRRGHYGSWYAAVDAVETATVHNNGRYTWNRLSRDAYDYDVQPKVQKFMELIADRTLVESRRYSYYPPGTAARRVAVWIAKGSGAKPQTITPPESFVEGHRLRQPFLSVDILMHHRRPDSPYWRKLVKQFAEEDEIIRLGGTFRLSMAHRTARNYSQAEMDAARAHLQEARNGARPALSFGPGTFSELLSRFEAAHRNSIPAKDPELDAHRAWVAEWRPDFFNRLLDAAAVAYYGRDNAVRVNYWTNQPATPFLATELRAPGLFSPPHFRFPDLPYTSFHSRVSVIRLRELTETVRKVDEAFSAFLAREASSEAQHRANVAHIRGLLADKDQWISNREHLENGWEAAAAAVGSKSFDPVKAVFDPVGKEAEAKDAAVWKSAGWAMRDVFEFRIKDLSLFERELRHAGDRVHAAAFEITFTPAVPEGGTVALESSNKPAKAQRRYDYWNRDGLRRFNARPEVLEVRMQHATEAGFDKAACVVVRADGSASVQERAVPLVDLLERLNYDFDYVSKELGVLARRCVFCKSKLSDSAAAGKRGYGDTCAKRFALQRGTVKAKPLPAPKEEAPVDGAPSRPVTAEGEEPPKMLLKLDFGQGRELELYHPAWKASHMLMMHLDAAPDPDEEIVLPAHEMEGEVWSYEAWRALWEAVELKKQPEEGHLVIGAIKVLLFLGDEDDKLAASAFGGVGGSMRVIASMIEDHRDVGELRAAFRA